MARARELRFEFFVFTILRAFQDLSVQGKAQKSKIATGSPENSRELRLACYSACTQGKPGNAPHSPPAGAECRRRSSVS